MSSRPRAFEEQLKAALLARLPEPPAPAPVRSFARRYGIPLAVGVATAAVVALVAVPGSGGRDGSLPAHPAPATSVAPREPLVERDGTIVIAMPKWAEVPETVRKLQAVGARVAMVQKKPPAECSNPGGGYLGPRFVPGTGTETLDLDTEPLRGRGDGMRLTINAKTVPDGHTLVIGRTVRPMIRLSDVSAGVIETAKVPSCEIDYSPSPEQEAKDIAEADAARESLRLRDGAGSQPPASPTGTR
ncbi:hypothetical protein [Streptomyces sp. NPDC002587]